VPNNPWLRLKYLTKREDSAELLPCVRPLHEEVGVVPFSPEKALRQIIEVLDRGFVLAVEDTRNGSIVGTLGLLPVDCWYGDGDVLIDLWFYVAEDHRAGAAQELLMAGAAAIADEARQAACSSPA
jgi:hypothetical protein